MLDLVLIYCLFYEKHHCFRKLLNINCTQTYLSEKFSCIWVLLFFQDKGYNNVGLVSSIVYADPRLKLY